MIARGRIARFAGTVVLCAVALPAWAETVQLLTPSKERNVHTIYVSPSAPAGGDGSSEKPFATIDGAQWAVRATLKAGFTGDVKVVLRKGTYRLTKPLVFGPADGGDLISTVCYMVEGYKPGRDATGQVVVSGGVEIVGWRDAGGGMWAAKVPAALKDANGQATFNELFVGDRRAVPARHPNKGYLRVDKAVDARRSLLFKAGDIPAVADANQVTLVYLHDWAITRVGVASIDTSARKLTTKYDVGSKASYWRICGYEPHPRYFVEGAREFLDAPGEWFLDRTRGEVLYRPMPGEKRESFKAVAPLAKQLLVIRGESSNPVRNLQFVGLTFEHCAWRHEGYRYAGVQACFHSTGKTSDEAARGSMTPAVDVQFARKVGLFDSTFQHLGGTGIWMGRGCRKCSAWGCTVRDVAGNGVMLGEPMIRTPEDGLAGGNIIRDCLVDRCGAVYYGAVGIWVGLSGENHVAQCHVRNLPYTGISVGWRWNPTPTPCKRNLVADNHIHHVMQVLSDGGGIYTLGRQPDTQLVGNWIHDIPVNAGRAESNGMFLDEGSTDLLIEANLIENVARSPLRFHKAGKNRVTGNVLVCGEGVPPVRYNVTPKENIELQGNQTPTQPAGGKLIDSERADALRKKAGPPKPGT